jgi:hypothetical protein
LKKAIENYSSIKGMLPLPKTKNLTTALADSLTTGLADNLTTNLRQARLI